MMKLLPIRPRPEPEEAITSWLSRLAAVYGVETQTFCELILGQFVRCDLDFDAGEEAFTRMEEATGFASDQFRVLHSMLGFPNVKFADSLNFHGTPWVFLNRSPAVRRWYFQVCPTCLREELPYYRRTWRLALFCVCQSHECYLLPACPNCHQPINVQRLALQGMERLTKCHSCGFDLTQATTKPASAEDCLLTQQHFALLSGQSHPLLDRLNTDGAAYFSVLHLFCHKLTQKLPRLKEWQRSVAAAIGVELLPDYSVCTNKTNFFEYYSDAESRQSILKAASMLLADWPVTFLNTAIPIGANTSDFIHARSHHPSWFRATLRELPDGRR